ncbi:MAG TPA: hypothetical protein VF189_05165, partial [Patescibacteria group bacterium]
TFCILVLLTSNFSIFAESTYILPYPSSMPGNITYKIHLLWEKVMSYWYFGSFGQFEYNLKESDKYLVESKTLFEYNQYLLGVNALEKSNNYFQKTLPELNDALKNGKVITDKKTLLQEAAKKHIEVLQYMENNSPKEYYWSPEKSPSSLLKIKDLIDKSIRQREEYL